MTFVFLFPLFIAFSLGLTCQKYDDPPKCVALGCDLHCQALGKASGFCNLNGASCVCNCIEHVKKNGNGNVFDAALRSAGVFVGGESVLLL
jgi:hypothetical protein